MPRKQILTILAAVMFLGVCPVQAADKTFNESGQILEGEEWNAVEIYNDDTVVDMLGGFVDYMQTFDESTMNVNGGELWTLDGWESSIANIYGGNVYSISVWDYAEANLYEGIYFTTIIARGQAGTVNMNGGNVKRIGSIESGLINLKGGSVLEYLGASDSAIVNIYGYDFSYNPNAGNWDGGQLTGFWLDGIPFTTDLYDQGTYQHINLVPEPTSLILFTVCGLFLMIKRESPNQRKKEIFSRK